jgi:hypothetical protein
LRQARTRAALPGRQSELTAVRSEIRKSDEKLDRYFQAFETGAVTQDACGPRIAALNDQLRSLRGREAELSAAVEDEYIAEPTPAELAEIRAMVTDGMRDAPIPQRKAILQKFVSEVRVQSRKAIHPVFRLPLRGVRELFRLVGRRGLEPRTSALTRPERCAGPTSDRVFT